MNANLPVRRAVVPVFGGFHARKFCDYRSLRCRSFQVLMCAIGCKHLHFVADESGADITTVGLQLGRIEGPFAQKHKIFADGWFLWSQWPLTTHVTRRAGLRCGAAERSPRCLNPLLCTVERACGKQALRHL